MEAYRVGQLEASSADALFEHALRCPRCHERHWAPYYEEASWMVDDFLDTVAGVDTSPGSPDTVAGDTMLLSLMDWTSSGTLKSGEDAAMVDAGSGKKGEKYRQFNEMTDECADPGIFPAPRLRLVGTVLPRVPRRRLIAAYQVYLGEGPPTVARSSRTGAALRVEAVGEGERVQLEALSDDVQVDAAPVSRAFRVPLHSTHLIQVGEQRYLFEAPHVGGVPWMGAGVVRHRGRSWPLTGEDTRVGRGEANAIQLPDRVVRTNLEWRAGALDTLSTPEERRQLAGLTLDAIDVSREHASILRDGVRIELRAMTDHAVFRIDGDEVQSVRKGQAGLELRPGAELRIGQRLFEYRAH